MNVKLLTNNWNQRPFGDWVRKDSNTGLAHRTHSSDKHLPEATSHFAIHIDFILLFQRQSVVSVRGIVAAAVRRWSSCIWHVSQIVALCSFILLLSEPDSPLTPTLSPSLGAMGSAAKSLCYLHSCRCGWNTGPLTAMSAGSCVWFQVMDPRPEVKGDAGR